MSLTKNDLKSAEAAAELEEAKDLTQNAVAVKAVEAAPEDKVLLELRLYKRYNRHGILYEKKDASGNPLVYKFSKKQAIVLLGETDDGRSIWRVWRPKSKEAPKPIPKPVDMSAPIIKDATNVEIHATSSDDPVSTGQRIDIGNDEEIESIIGTGEVVQV